MFILTKLLTPQLIALLSLAASHVTANPPRRAALERSTFQLDRRHNDGGVFEAFPRRSISASQRSRRLRLTRRSSGGKPLNLNTEPSDQAGEGSVQPMPSEAGHSVSHGLQQITRSGTIGGSRRTVPIRSTGSGIEEDFQKSLKISERPAQESQEAEAGSRKDVKKAKKKKKKKSKEILPLGWVSPALAQNDPTLVPNRPSMLSWSHMAGSKKEEHREPAKTEEFFLPTQQFPDLPRKESHSEALEGSSKKSVVKQEDEGWAVPVKQKGSKKDRSSKKTKKGKKEADYSDF